MKIELKQIIPIPLADSIKKESFWGNDWVFESGERILLNAASGKGKTTFTHLLTGLRSDYSGEIKMGGKSIQTFGMDDWTILRKEKIAVVYQDLQLFTQLTVAENFSLKLQLTHCLELDFAREMLEKVGLSNRWNDKCEVLSMGQKQRVAIIRSLLQPFEWLILDEPFSHLDRENARICMGIIKQRVDELKAGFVLTTLDPSDEMPVNRKINL